MRPLLGVYGKLRAIGAAGCLVALGLALAAQMYPQAPGGDVSKWITFSSRAGWNIKRPSDLSVSSCRQCDDPTDPDVIVAFFRSSGEVVAMVEPLADKSPTLSAREWLSGVARGSILSPIISEEWTSIEGAPTLIVVNGGPDSDRSENVYVLRGAKTWAVRFPDIRDAGVRTLCRRMLSTFSFSPH
jgi:hypothetical protein